MIARCAVDDSQDGEVTIPARKLFDIVRALPDGSKVTVSQTGDKITVQAGRSRFTLASLPANDFPSTINSSGKNTDQMSLPMPEVSCPVPAWWMMTWSKDEKSRPAAFSAATAADRSSGSRQAMSPPQSAP